MKPWVKGTSEGRLYVDTKHPEWEKWFVEQIEKYSKLNILKKAPPMSGEQKTIEEIKDVYVLIDELHADADYLFSRAIQKPEDKDMLVASVRQKLDLMRQLAVPETTVRDGIKIIKLMQQSAALKSALAELIPIAERMQATCEDGESKCYDNEWDAADAIEYKAVIDRAKELLNKTE